jgi:tRNA(fMet)-specific endonuclease VapC
MRKKGNPLVQVRLAAHTPTDIALCAVVVAELRYGAESSADPPKEHAKVDVFTAQFVSLPFEDTAARRFGEIRHALTSAGTQIGPYDTMIAAIALAHDLILVTHNTKEFSRIAGLKLEDWEIP